MDKFAKSWILSFISVSSEWYYVFLSNYCSFYRLNLATRVTWGWCAFVYMWRTCVCYSQGPQLGHVVETRHRYAADVVVVQGSVEHQAEKAQLKPAIRSAQGSIALTDSTLDLATQTESATKAATPPHHYFLFRPSDLESVFLSLPQLFRFGLVCAALLRGQLGSVSVKAAGAKSSAFPARHSSTTCLCPWLSTSHPWRACSTPLLADGE